DLELAAARARQRVVLRAPGVRRIAPFGVEPAGTLEALQRGEEGAGIHLEHAARDLLDPPADAEAVQRPEAQRLEDQHVQGPLDDVGVLLHRGLYIMIVTS